jgi:hypothetical protein
MRKMGMAKTAHPYWLFLDKPPKMIPSRNHTYNKKIPDALYNKLKITAAPILPSLYPVRIRFTPYEIAKD